MLTIEKLECGFEGLAGHLANAVVPTPDLIPARRWVVGSARKSTPWMT